MKVLAFTLLATSSLCLAQVPAPKKPLIGDARAAANVPSGEVEKPWPADLPIPPAPPLTPEEELKTFKLPKGFHAELVAADPQIGEPVAMQWDEHGRIWVVEMRGYMPNIDGLHEDEPNGRIVILSDTDGDGRMDKETVFLDKLVMPRAMMLRKGGAVIAEPPMLYWCPDANGDGVADSKDPILPNYATGGNPEHMPNGLLLALDNWIYNAKSNDRFRFNQAGEFKREKTVSRGQWGICQDDAGRLHYNYNSDQLRADLLPAHYLARNGNFKAAEGVNVQIAKDQRTFPGRVNPGVNRGYRSAQLKGGRLAEFTAASAPIVYRGELFPAEFRGNSFVPEPSGNMIKRNLHVEKDGEVMAKNAYEQEEFMTSTDERFRPVALANGPDGALYITDMYRGIIQHVTYITPWLRRQYIERKLDAPTHQGRIWRIVPDGAKPAPAPKLATFTPAQLVAELGSANGWRRDTAQRLLVESGDAGVVPLLKKAVASAKTPLARLHALWTLEGLEKVDAATLTPALSDIDTRVRAAAIRLAEPLLKTDAKLAASVLAMVQDKAADVQHQLLCTLGDIATPQATAATVALLAAASESRLARSAAISGLKGRELDFLRALAGAPAWKAETPGKANIVAQLARCILEERKPERLTALLDLASQPEGGWQPVAMLTGITGAIPVPPAPAGSIAEQQAKIGAKPPTSTGALAKGFKPVKFPAEPPQLARLAAIADPAIQQRAAKVAALLAWPGKPGYIEEKKAAPLTPAHKEFVAAGKNLYTAVCAGCHLPNGIGQEGLSAPLAGSEWVTGSEGRLVRIVLHGVGGPITAAGKETNLEMPGIGGVFTDEQIAQILSYIRRDFGNEAPIVEPATVEKIRAATKDRAGSWTAAELEAVN